jgi:ribonuclease HIII
MRLKSNWLNVFTKLPTIFVNTFPSKARPMLQTNETFDGVKLDDSQVISGRLGDLSQHEVISLANQLYRNSQKKLGHELMAYQHRKFIQSKPNPPKAA